MRDENSDDEQGDPVFWWFIAMSLFLTFINLLD